MSLTFEERHRLRELRSELLKARLPKPKDPCGGCGMNRDHHTPGCNQCQQRHARRRRREAERVPCKGENCTATVLPENHSKRPVRGYCRRCANQRPSWK